MKRYRFVVGFAVMLIAIVSLVGSVTAASLGLPNSGASAKGSDQAKIQSAMSAAPRSISKNATILDWAMDSSTQFHVLRQGTNGWSCFPDWEGSPGDDPECVDANFLDWTYAMMTNGTPNVKGPGIAYMLRGCSEAPPSDTWVADGPHIMLIVPSTDTVTGGLDPNYFSTDSNSGLPFIMSATTVWAHLHIPVSDQVR